jgi:hypothetical protein
MMHSHAILAMAYTVARRCDWPIVLYLAALAVVLAITVFS